MNAPENIIMPFGKYRGKTLSHILQEDPPYLDWLLTADIKSATLKLAITQMCKKYAAEIERAIGD